jgi:thiol-disulfide isomerase/thioredoxin
VSHFFDATYIAIDEHQSLLERVRIVAAAQNMPTFKNHPTNCWCYHHLVLLVIPILCCNSTMGSINFVSAFLVGIPGVVSHHHHFRSNGDNTVTIIPTSTTRLYSEVKFKNFDDVLDAFHEETLLIYFGTNKCGPCQLMKKELTAAKKRLLGRGENGGQLYHTIKFFSLDTEKWPHLGTRYGIQRLPCILVVRDGVVQKRLEGLTKAEVIVKELDELNW